MMPFQKVRYAMEMKSVITHSPSYCTDVISIELLLTCLALYTQVQKRHAADRTVIEIEIRHPHCSGSPSLNFELPLYCHLSKLDHARVFPLKNSYVLLGVRGALSPFAWNWPDGSH